MSTDYSAICSDCREWIHIGQVMAGHWSFGYGTGDVETAREQGEWLARHVWHEGGVRVVCDDQINDDQHDRLRRVELK